MTNNQICPLCNKSWECCECDVEKDLGVKIGSPEEMAWKTIKRGNEEAIAKSKRDIEILELVAVYADKRMKEEAEKFKNQKV